MFDNLFGGKKKALPPLENASSGRPNPRSVDFRLSDSGKGFKALKAPRW